MCKPASFIINKSGKVFWSMKTDSHSGIITEHELCESIANHSPDTMIVCLAKVEITPPGGNMIAPLDQWEYHDNEDQQPDWYDRAKVEPIARLALAEWHKARVITVKPDHPLKGGKYWIYGTSAELRGSSIAELMDSSSAVLRDSSSAELWDSSSAELWDSSGAVLRGSSRAELWDSSSAVLRDSSRAELWDSSTVNSYNRLKPIKQSNNSVFIDRTQTPPVITCGWLVNKPSDK